MERCTNACSAGARARESLGVALLFGAKGYLFRGSLSREPLHFRTGNLVIAGFTTGLAIIQTIEAKFDVHHRLAQAAELLTIALLFGLVALTAVNVFIGIRT